MLLVVIGRSPLAVVEVLELFRLLGQIIALEFSCSSVSLSYLEQYGAVIVDTVTKCKKLVSQASFVLVI